MTIKTYVKRRLLTIAAYIMAIFIFTGCSANPADSIAAGIDGIVTNIIDAAVEDIDPEDLNHGTDRLPDGGFEVPMMDVRIFNVEMINNRVHVENHGEDYIRVVFMPPDRGHFVTPDIRLATETLNITEDHRLSQNINTGTGELRIYLPEQADIYSSEIQTVNGTVNASGIRTGGLNLETVNGAVILSDSQVSGLLSISTVNGGITLNNVDADMDRASLTTVLGRITIN